MSDAFSDLVDAFEKRRAREEAELLSLRSENQRLRTTLEWLHRLSQTDSNPYVHRKIGEALAGDGG